MSSSASRTSTSSADLTGPAKLEEVTRLLDKLTSDLQVISLLPHQRDNLLEQLKVYGRDPTNADPIFTKEGIETITRHAFNSPSLSTSRNALRCLANAMLLKPDTRRIFLNLGYEAKACNKLKNDSRDDEFLVSRVIFLTTYDPTADIGKLIDEHHLAENVCLNLSRHTRQYTTKQKSSKDLDSMEDMALTESLKLMFNLTHFCPQRVDAFSPALPHVLMLLNKRSLPPKPLDAPIGALINSLLNLALDHKDNLRVVFPRETPDMNARRLLDILDKSTNGLYSDEEIEQSLSPILTLIRRIYEIAPKDVQQNVQLRLLPSIDDRQQPLGRGDTLSARLLRLSTNPTTPQVRDSISALLFELSDKDATTFVQNVGYGFASGFLFQNNIKMPETALEAFSTEEGKTSSSFEGSTLVNPITGQTLDSEPVIELPPMTQEEKEREAERLFVLFERLKKTGVMNVRNPVETARDEGRFQELADDDDSD